MWTFGFTELALGILVLAAGIVPFWKICAKMGYPGWLSLLAYVPFVNIAVLFWLAFAEWPLERHARMHGDD